MERIKFYPTENLQSIEFNSESNNDSNILIKSLSKYWNRYTQREIATEYINTLDTYENINNYECENIRIQQAKNFCENKTIEELEDYLFCRHIDSNLWNGLERTVLEKLIKLIYI